MTKKKPHGNHEKNCKICQMSNETKEEIRFFYVNWYNQTKLTKKYAYKVFLDILSSQVGLMRD